MSEAIIITPVKDSIETTQKTIDSIYLSDIKFEYHIFNDFSQPDTKVLLEKTQKKYGFNLINLEDITSNPSPNYKLVLKMAQSMALKRKLPLIVIESDVIIKKNTLSQLLDILNKNENPALIGAITTDIKGRYNFPYNYEKTKDSKIVNTSRSLSFCCTLMSQKFLNAFDFAQLSQKKDWFDVYISRRAKRLGFNNYLAKGVEVIHLPHSSRPWKNLKYTNPVLYYYKKLVNKRDRI